MAVDAGKDKCFTRFKLCVKKKNTRLLKNVSIISKIMEKYRKTITNFVSIFGVKIIIHIIWLQHHIRLTTMQRQDLSYVTLLVTMSTKIATVNYRFSI